MTTAPPPPPGGTGTPPAGWYADPWNPQGVRWWSGTDWTGSSRDSVASNTQELETTGYILAVLLPVIGFVLGIVLLAKNRVGPGLAVILLSAFCAIVWTAVLA